MEYQKHIRTDEENNVFLHRTHTSLVDAIMREGLGCCAGDLLGTATWQPSDLENAEGLYRQTHKGNNAVVVIKIPTSRIKEIPKSSRNSIATVKGIGYFHPNRAEFTIRPEFVDGWINRETDAYTPNPYENRKPVEGYEQFEDMFD